VLRREESSQQR